MLEKEVKIEKQLSLPLKNAFQMSLRSIKIRFGRSIITTMSIVLGIAFFMSVMSNSAFTMNILQKGPENIKFALQQQNLEDMQAKQTWLVLLSLLVCTVGIINSMLMSVTERSKEIGTMKCLGALDKFIVELFVLEAILQGIIGSCIGIIIGILVTLMGYVLQYKWIIFKFFPVVDIIKYSFTALILGTFLTIIGVLYPAFLSAKMEPAEAIRREI